MFWSRLSFTRTAGPAPLHARAPRRSVPDARRPRGRRLWLWIGGLILAALSAAAVVAAYRVHAFVTEPIILPMVPPLNPLDTLIDRTPVRITTTAAWNKIPEVVTVHRLLTDRSLWRRMHFDDWDRVPVSVREQALGAMIEAYADVFEGPRVWRTMTVFDWDKIPQPIRAMAYLRMIWYWAGIENVGAEFGMQPHRLAPTIAAIVMAESWFEHRAFNENPFGNRDLGLAQCSDHCREVMAEMAASGAIDFAPDEEDYFDPWIATRVATVWFARELHRADGDVDMAIRAYHRGIDNAWDEKGDTYLEGVRRRRTRYILNQNAPGSWQFLARSIAPL